MVQPSHPCRPGTTEILLSQTSSRLFPGYDKYGYGKDGYDKEGECWCLLLLGTLAASTA